MEEITLKRIGYKVEGVAKVNPWIGATGYIKMIPFNLTDISDDTLKKNLNDSGFGVRSIEGAVCMISELFEMGFTKYHSTKNIGNITDKDLIAIDDMD